MPPKADQKKSSIDVDAESSPLTLKVVMTWVSVIGMVLSCAAYVWGLRGDLALTAKDVSNNTSRIAEVDSRSIARHESQEREISDLKGKADSLSTKVGEMSGKLDTMNAILTRIDNKLKNP